MTKYYGNEKDGAMKLLIAISLKCIVKYVLSNVMKYSMQYILHPMKQIQLKNVIRVLISK